MQQQPLKVMLVGNNPSDLDKINSSLIDYKPIKYVSSIAFDSKQAIKNAVAGELNFIVLDDNLGEKTIHYIIKKFSKLKSTKDLPITILKNNNREGSKINGLHDYVLKSGTGPENLHRSFINALKLRKTHLYLYKSYKKGKLKLNQMLDVFSI